MRATAPIKAPTQEPTTVLREMGDAEAEVEEASSVAEASETSAVGVEAVVVGGRVTMGVCVGTRFGADVNSPPGATSVSKAKVGAAEALLGSTMRGSPLMPVADTVGTKSA